MRIKLSTKARKNLTILLFLTPALALLTLWIIIPVVWNICLSFTDKALVGEKAKEFGFVGLTNYAKILKDPSFHHSLNITLKFTIVSAIIGQLLVGLLLAVLLYREIKGSAMFSAFGLLPLAVPEVVFAFMWISMLASGELGTLNRMLGLFGIKSIAWLREYPLTSIIIANIWRGITFAAILFMGALRTIPREVFEAAEMDGATGYKKFIHITLPMIKFIILFFLLMTTITTLNLFGSVYAMTRGGPGSATEILGIYTYFKAFKYFEVGLGAATCLILLSITLVFGIVYVKLLKVRM